MSLTIVVARSEVRNLVLVKLIDSLLDRLLTNLRSVNTSFAVRLNDLHDRIQLILVLRLGIVSIHRIKSELFNRSKEHIVGNLILGLTNELHLSIGEDIDNQIHSRFNINLQHRILILLSITQSFICLLHKESPDSFSDCIQMNATRSGIHVIAERIYPRLKRSRVCKRKLKRQTSLNSLFSTVIT